MQSTRPDYPWLSTLGFTPFALAHTPTPLQPLERLSRELGGPNIWVKRDDCTGLGGGGNKTRKLEYLVGEALQQGADTVITFGAVQSNHARQTAAACAKAGLACHQVLAQRVPVHDDNYETGGNVLLSHLAGAKSYLMPPEEVADFTRALRTRLTDEGAHVYMVPAGGSSATGVLGYAECAGELVNQCAAAGITPGCVVHASASAGTQAGLIYGFGALSSATRVLGINVFHPNPQTLEERVADLLTATEEKFGGLSERPAIETNHAYFGEGYGIPTTEACEAINWVASMEGLYFDPVYSGKALAGLLDQINVGAFRDWEDVVFIHTGGAPSLHVYEDLLNSHL